MTNFSYQLYSSRNFPPLSETLEMLAHLGYKGVEGYGGLFADRDKVGGLAEALRVHGLAMPTGHFGLDMLEGEVDRVLEIAGTLDLSTIYCPHIGPDARPDSAGGWYAFGQRLSTAAQPYRDAGLGFGWHNHDFEFRPMADGAIPIEAMFEGGPDLEWEADLAWVIKGGADPLQWIGTYRDRITAVHVKDIAPAGQNADEDGWADVGHGTVDWPGLMTALEQTPCRRFIMEHDNPSDARRFAERSIKAAQSF